MGDPIGHRSKRPPRARHAAVAHNDHSGALVLCDVHQRVRWLPNPNVRLTLYAELRKPLLRSLDGALGTSSRLLIVSPHRSSAGRRRRAPPNHSAAAVHVAAYDVKLHAKQPGELTRAVQCKLGSVRAISPNDDWSRCCHPNSLTRCLPPTARRALTHTVRGP
jgi:hypothetical protein